MPLGDELMALGRAKLQHMALASLRGRDTEHPLANLSIVTGEKNKAAGLHYATMLSFLVSI